MPEDLRKLPCPAFDEKTISDYVSDNIQISKWDWNSFETSWEFKYHPLVCKTDKMSEAFTKWRTECDILLEKCES